MADDELQMAATSEEDLREQAIASLKKKQAFRTTLAAYLIVNAFLIAIWAISDSDNFWPIWVIAFWGVGLAFQAWDAYGRRHTVTEADISDEMNKLRGG